MKRYGLRDDQFARIFGLGVFRSETPIRHSGIWFRQWERAAKGSGLADHRPPWLVNWGLRPRRTKSIYGSARQRYAVNRPRRTRQTFSEIPIIPRN
jgi:hypothetical protein